MGLARIHVVISGEVQGVGFRYAAEHRAQRLGLTGWVRNRSEGAVEAVFEGEQDQVEQMVAWCRRGPSGAEVTDVQIEWQPPTGEFTDFRITF